jgi:predicted DCC family thiol-disulfide oxidoreductase YuxK
MSEVVHQVANPPQKPLMIYDGDCNFCKYWVGRWRKWTSDAIDYLPSQDPQIIQSFPEIPREQFDVSVQFIETDGSVYSGAEAVFRSLAKNPKHQRPLRWYSQSRLFARLTEAVYHFVARHRSFFSWLSGTHP